MSVERKQWADEREFFDRKARETGEAYDAARVQARYRTHLARALYNKEYRLFLAGDLKGKKVLDIGCGMGETSLLLASFGADVTGLDISEGSIAVATRRAANAGLSERCRFIASPFETHAGPEGGYDLVWCEAFLHHVLLALDDVLASIRRLVRPGGHLIVSEPVRFSSTLTAVRRFIPPFPEGTEEERPLTREEVHRVLRGYEEPVVRYWGPVSRVGHRMVMRRRNYEGLGQGSRMLVDLLERADRQIMRTPGLSSLAMIVVARVRRPLAG